MTDLLFCDLRGRRRERRFKAGSQFEIDRFTDYELRARYRFGRESILYITNLVARDISRNTRRNHALHPLHQVLIALRFYASGRATEIYVMSMRCQSSGTVSGAHVRWSTTVISKPNANSKFKLSQQITNRSHQIQIAVSFRDLPLLYDIIGGFK